MNTKPPSTPTIRSYFQRVIFSLMTFVVCLPSIALAQAPTGTITGRVINQGTQEYLRNTIIKVVGTDIQTTAQDGGNYTLNNVPTGEAKISFAYAGLDTQEIAVAVVGGQTVTKDVALTSAEYGDVIQLGEFVVASEKEGNAKAIMEQKASLESKKVLATDTFGSISEGNVGEFLKYLPGISIDYVEADARSVSIGGLDPKYTSVTLDGAPIASSGMGAASGATANRGFEFEQMSISSIETVELMRTPQPDNPGNAIAGVINLRSKGAFDRDGRRIRLNAGLAYNSMSGSPFEKHPGWDDEDHYRVMPNFGVEYSDTFLNKKLGVIAGYNYSYTFSEQKAETIFYAFDNNPNNNDSEVPRITSIGMRDSPKPTIRYNGNIRVDYKFSPDFWVSARAEYAKYHAKFYSRDFNIDFRNLTGNVNTTFNSPDVDGTGAQIAGPIDPSIPFSLSSQTTANGYTRIDQGGGGTNKYGELLNYSFGAHYKKGSFRADFTGSMSRSQTWYKDRGFGFWWSVNPPSLGGQSFRLDRNGPADPSFQITRISGPDFRNPANYPNGFSVTTNDRRAEDQRYLGKLDMRYDWDAFVPIAIKFGGSIDETVNNTDRPIAGFSGAHLGADGVAATADDNFSRYLEPSYRMNFDFGTNIDGIPNADRWSLYKEYQANPQYFAAPTQQLLLQYALQNARDAKEQVDAIYNQWILKFGKLSVAPGVRYERTRGTAQGPVTNSDNEARRILTGSISNIPVVPTNTLEWTQAKFGSSNGSYGSGRAASHQDYDTWLRYLHASYNFTDDLVVKASYNQGIARPDMNWLVGGLSVVNEDPNTAGDNIADAGNANLKPEQSDTINVTLEYYPKALGQMSVSAYRRDMTNLIRRLDIRVPTGGSWNGEPLPATVSPDPWIIRTRDNVSKAHLTSIELAFARRMDFIPGPLGRLYLNTNYTHIEYDDYDKFLRPQNMANLSLDFPYRNFRLKWNSNWREGYRVNIIAPVTVAGINGAAPSTINPTFEALNGWAEYVRESFTHTIDFNWEFRRNTSFFITGRNIFNQDQGIYRGRSDVRTRWVKTGAIWTSGVTATF